MLGEVRMVELERGSVAGPSVAGNKWDGTNSAAERGAAIGKGPRGKRAKHALFVAWLLPSSPVPRVFAVQSNTDLLLVQVL